MVLSLSHVFNLLRKHNANCFLQKTGTTCIFNVIQNMPTSHAFPTSRFSHVLSSLLANIFLCYQSEGWKITFNIYFIETRRNDTFKLLSFLYFAAFIWVFFFQFLSKVLYGSFLYLVLMDCLLNLFLSILFSLYFWLLIKKISITFKFAFVSVNGRY